MTMATAETSRLGSAAGERAVIDLLVVVVNFRTPDLTADCLRSLGAEREDGLSLRVVAVDNASGDDSAERIRAAVDEHGWGGWIDVIETPRNGGFAYGNNRGFEAGFARCRPRFVLLLNSDTVVHRGCLRRCIEVMDSDERIGAMSCCLLNADGSVQNVARRFPTPARMWVSSLGLPWRLRAFAWADCDDPGWDRLSGGRDVDWLGGAFLMVRADLLERIGGLDERFFFYGEDIEFCHRIRRAGYRCRYDSSAKTTHLGGQSSDPDKLPARSRVATMWKGRYIVQRLCFGRLAPWLVWAVDVPTTALRVAAARLRGNRARSTSESQLLSVLLKEARP
jgi:N-acetylglucosaminyl-diphospho-decaprenol L-rhamnosyltransferase